MHTDELLQRQARRLEILNRIAKTISRDLDLERTVQTVTDVATELSGAKFGAFFYNMTNQSGESYVLYTLSGAPREAFEKFGMPRNTAIFDPTFRGTGIVRSDDIRNDPRYGKMSPHFGMPQGHLPVVSYLAVPVMGRSNEVLGGLFFGHDQPAMFGAEIEELIAGVAAHAAIAIENARLHAAAKIGIEQRSAAEAVAQQLAAVVEGSDDAILTKDLNSIITSWNKGAEQLFGYTAEEIVGKSVMVLIPLNPAEEEAKILARIRAGERVHHYETVRQRKDGSLVEISLTVSPVRNLQGEIIGASKIARDITELKRAQQQQKMILREMDHRVKNLFALTGGLVALSARSAKTPADLAANIQQRLGALARAHDLTISVSSGDTPHTERPTTMHALIAAVISPYDGTNADGNPRFAVRGADTAISPQSATSVALLIHEFATNAAKYGALSSPKGQVQIDCSQDADKFFLAWSESGGPAVAGRPDGDGFGTLLARTTVEGQLSGTLEREWRPEGLKILIAVSRSRLVG